MFHNLDRENKEVNQQIILIYKWVKKKYQNIKIDDHYKKNSGIPNSDIKSHNSV